MVYPAARATVQAVHCTARRAPASSHQAPRRPQPRYVQSVRPHNAGEKRGLRVRRSVGRRGPTRGRRRPPARRGRPRRGARPLATGSLGGPCWPPALPAYTGHPLVPVRPSCHSLGPEFSPFICVLRYSDACSPPWRVHGMEMDVNGAAGYTPSQAVSHTLLHTPKTTHMTRRGPHVIACRS